MNGDMRAQFQVGKPWRRARRSARETLWGRAANTATSSVACRLCPRCSLIARACPRGLGLTSPCVQTVRHLQALNYWGKTSDQMDAYVGDDKTGVIFIDPNTTPLWSPSIPVSRRAALLL